MHITTSKLQLFVIWTPPWIHSWRNKNWSETFASVRIKRKKEHLQTSISARSQKDYFLSRSLHGEVFLIRQRRKWIACFQWSHEATVACDGHDILLVHGKCKTKGYVLFFFFLIFKIFLLHKMHSFSMYLACQCFLLCHFRLKENLINDRWREVLTRSLASSVHKREGQLMQLSEQGNTV